MPKDFFVQSDEESEKEILLTTNTADKMGKLNSKRKRGFFEDSSDDESATMIERSVDGNTLRSSKSTPLSNESKYVDQTMDTDFNKQKGDSRIMESSINEKSKEDRHEQHIFNENEEAIHYSPLIKAERVSKNIVSKTIINRNLADRISEYPDRLDYHDPSCSKFPSECKCRNIAFIFSNYYKSAIEDRCGKWMLFIKEDDIDYVWCKVKTLLNNELLGISAKVNNTNCENAAKKNTFFVICIYTKDYKDIPDVMRVLLMLRDSHLFNGIENCRINYKTDKTTMSGQYASTSAAINAGFLHTKKKSKDPVCIYHSRKEKPNELLLYDKSVLAKRQFDFDKSDIIHYSYKEHMHKIL